MLPPLLEFLAFPGGKNAKFRHSERMKPRSPYAIRRAWNKCVRHHNKLFGSYQISFLNQCRIQFPETIKKIIFSISPEFVYRHACINKESALAEWIVSEFNIKEKFPFSIKEIIAYAKDMISGEIITYGTDTSVISI